MPIYDGTLFADNYLWSGLGLLLSIVLLAIMLMVATYDPDHLSLLLVGMLVPLPPILGTSAAVGSWYAGSRDWRTDPVGFADHLGGALSHTIASASSPPGSSDSGGSSGGGGGGGGSGW
jgi:hypothetical protein